jgi:hypothetical protein
MTSTNTDVKLISQFVFGSGFETFTELLFKKISEGEIDISKEEYTEFVENSVIEMSTGIIAFIQDFGSSRHTSEHRIIGAHLGSTKSATSSATTSSAMAEVTHCKFILTRGDNKGRACNKPAIANSTGCNAHASKMAVAEPSSANKKSSEPSSANKKSSEPSSANKKSDERCEYIMSRGVRQGENCGAPVKNGFTMCNAHSKTKGTKRDVVPASKSVISKTKKGEKSDDKIVAMKNNKLYRDSTRNIIYHKETGFVFKSSDDISVIGRIEIENGKPTGEVRDLTKSDISEIDEYSIYDGTSMTETHFKINEKYLEDEDIATDNDTECEDEIVE